MKIVICNGTNEAGYLIDSFRKKRNKLVIINSSRSDAQYLVKSKHVSVHVGNPWREHVLDEAGVKDADLFICLCEKDTDNFASCLLAKKRFGVHKTICVVKDPSHVELYRKLGIDSVISSTYLLGQSITNESSVESMMNTLSLENDKIVIIEYTLGTRHRLANKRIMDIDFPDYASISAIYRNYRVIIPKGLVLLRAKDKLLIVTSKEDEERLTEYLKRKV